jgi:hypothetical protein
MINRHEHLPESEKRDNKSQIAATLSHVAPVVASGNGILV